MAVKCRGQHVAGCLIFPHDKFMEEKLYLLPNFIVLFPALSVSQKFLHIAVEMERKFVQIFRHFRVIDSFRDKRQLRIQNVAVMESFAGKAVFRYHSIHTYDDERVQEMPLAMVENFAVCNGARACIFERPDVAFDRVISLCVRKGCRMTNVEHAKYILRFAKKRLVVVRVYNGGGAVERKNVRNAFAMLAEDLSLSGKKLRYKLYRSTKRRPFICPQDDGGKYNISALII
jgi:hypothetical protein